MKGALATLVLLVLTAFSLATDLTRRQADFSRDSREGSGLLNAVLGDSRRLFAKYIYSKADAYFHSGYYPSFLDGQEKRQGLGIAAATSSEDAEEHASHASHENHEKDAHAHEGHNHGSSHDDHEICDFIGQPKDWIDRFSRNFYPSEHKHLGEDAQQYDPKAESSTSGGNEREVLPWFRLAAELDPDRPETYIVGAYWLRSRLNRITEAEQFLREGLRANPGHPELLFELGRIYEENLHNTERACNIWELSLAKLEQTIAKGEEVNLLLHSQLLGNLAKVEEGRGNAAAAVKYLKALSTISPHKESIQRWIEEVTAKSGGAVHPVPDAHHGHDH